MEEFMLLVMEEYHSGKLDVFLHKIFGTFGQSKIESKNQRIKSSLLCSRWELPNNEKIVPSSFI